MTTKAEAKAKIVKIKQELDELQKIVDTPDQRPEVQKVKDILSNWWGGKVIAIDGGEIGVDKRIHVTVDSYCHFEATLGLITRTGLKLTGLHGTRDVIHLYFE